MLLRMRAAPLLLAVCAACAPFASLPEANPPAAGTFRVGIVGWNLEVDAVTEVDGQLVPLRPRLWIPPLSNLPFLEDRSVHWFDLSADLEAFLPEESRSQDLVPNGVPLPIQAVHQLTKPESGLKWVIQQLDDPAKFGWPNPTIEPGPCGVMQACFRDSLCSEPSEAMKCGLPSVTPPEGPEIECPPSWVNLGDDEDWFCAPPEFVSAGEAQPPTAPVDCPLAGEANFGQGCEPLEVCVGPGFAPLPPGASNVLYVDSTEPTGGDGSLIRPFMNIPSAVRQGTTLMIASGSYAWPSNLDLDAIAHLVGSCASEVLVQGTLTSSIGGTLVSGIRVASMGPRGAFVVHGGAVEIRGVELRASTTALRVEAGTVTVSRSLLVSGSQNPAHGALVQSGGQLNSRDSVFLGNTIAANADVDLQTTSFVGTNSGAPTILLSQTSGKLTNANVFSTGSDYAVKITEFKPSDVSRSFEFSDVRVIGELGMTIGNTTATVSLARVAMISTAEAPRWPQAPAFLGLFVESAIVSATDLSIHGFDRGISLEVNDAEPGVEISSAVDLHKVWIRWSADAAVRASSGRMTVTAEDLWLQAVSDYVVDGVVEPEVSALVIDQGDWSVARARVRPRGRHMWRTSEKTHLVSVEDVEAVGDLGRLFIFRPGTNGNIARVRSLGLSDGLVVLSDLGDPLLLTIDDITFRINPDTRGRRGEAVHFFSAEHRWNRFQILGLDSGNAQDTDVVLDEGHITVSAGATWNEEFRNALRSVSIALEPSQ